MSKRKASLPSPASKKIRIEKEKDSDETPMLQIQKDFVTADSDVPVARMLLESLEIEEEPFSKEIIAKLKKMAKKDLTTEQAQAIFHYVTRALIRSLATNKHDSLAEQFQLFDTMVTSYTTVLAQRQFAFDETPLTFEHFFFIFYTASSLDLDYLEKMAQNFFETQIEPSKNHGIHSALVDERDPFSSFFYNHLIYASLSQMLKLVLKSLSEQASSKLLHVLASKTMKLIIAFIQREGITMKLFSKSLFTPLIRVAHFGGDIELINKIMEFGLTELPEKFVSSGIRYYGPVRQFIQENRGGTFKFLSHVHEALASMPQAQPICTLFCKQVEEKTVKQEFIIHLLYVIRNAYKSFRFDSQIYYALVDRVLGTLITLGVYRLPAESSPDYGQIFTLAEEIIENFDGDIHFELISKLVRLDYRVLLAKLDTIWKFILASEKIDMTPYVATLFDVFISNKMTYTLIENLFLAFDASQNVENSLLVLPTFRAKFKESIIKLGPSQIIPFMQMIIDNTESRIKHDSDFIIFPLTMFGFNVIINDSNFGNVEKLAKRACHTIIKPSIEREITAANCQLYYAMSTCIKRTEEFSSDIYTLKSITPENQELLIDYRDGTGLTLEQVEKMYSKISYRLKAIISYVIFQRLYTFNQQLMINPNRDLELYFGKLFDFLKKEFLSVASHEQGQWNGYIESVNSKQEYAIMLWYLVTRNFGQMVPYLTADSFTQVIDFLLVQKLEQLDSMHETSLFTMGKITQEFWDDSELFEFVSIRPIFQSVLFERILQGLDEQTKSKVLKDEYPPLKKIDNEFIRLITHFPKKYFESAYYAKMVRVLVWYLKSSRNESFKATISSILSSFVKREELESAAQFFSEDLSELPSDFTEHVIRSRVDSTKHRAKVVDFFTQVFAEDDANLKRICCRILTNKFDQIIPQKFNDRFDENEQLKLKPMSAVITELLPSIPEYKCDDRSLQLLLQSQVALVTNTTVTNEKLFSKTKKLVADESSIQNVIDAVTLFGATCELSGKLFQRAFEKSIPNATLMARLVSRADLSQQLVILKLLLAYMEDAPQLDLVQACQVFLENCQLSVIIPAKHTEILHTLAHVMHNQPGAEITAAVGQLCIVLVNMVNQKISPSAKTHLLDILRSCVAVNGAVFSNTCDLIDHMFRYNIFPVKFAPLLVDIMKRLLEKLFDTELIQSQENVQDLGQLYDRLSHYKMLSQFYEQIVFDFVSVVGKHQVRLSQRSQRIDDSELVKRRSVQALCSSGFYELLMQCSGRVRKIISERLEGSYFHRQLFVDMCNNSAEKQ